MTDRKTKYLSGKASLAVRLRFRLSMLKYLLQRRKFPLFTLWSSKGGVLQSSKMLKKIKVCKVVKFNEHYYFSLNVPHWPSKPFDAMAAKGGLNICASGTPRKKQIDMAILGITGRCKYKCIHCYEYFNLCDHDRVPVSSLMKTIKGLQENGVSIIVFSGGEPMLRYDDLISMLEAGDHSRSDFHLHTSGYGITPEIALSLKKAGLQAAGIGLDDVDAQRNDAFRGYNGAFEQAVKAIRCFIDAGIFTYVNTCLTKDLIRSNRLMRYFELMKKLNVGIVRWLDLKPCGAFWNADANMLPDEEDRTMLTNLYIRANTGKEHRDFPLIAWDSYAESPENMGCMMAGHSHLYIDSCGNVEPCVFLPVAFGNIMNEDFNDIFNRMRSAVPKPVHISCPAVPWSKIIKKKINAETSLPLKFEEIQEEFKSLVNDI